MKKYILGLLSIIIAIGLTGCGSSIYQYNIEPTPIKQGTTKYMLKDLNLVSIWTIHVYTIMEEML